jgi:PTH1 family peptidyl-tRNA hydrolase
MIHLSFSLFGRPKKTGPVEWLVVGLGNPGKKYQDTRHNAGFHVVDQLADLAGLKFDENRNKALIARGELFDHPVALVKPQTFMNNSGEAIGAVARFYKVPAEKVLVIYDDLDLPNAKLRLRPKGGSGGHKGLISIIQHLGTQDFPRVRIGIGRPPGQMSVTAYVLQKFSQDEWSEIEQTYQEAQEAIRSVLNDGIEHTMNQFN